MKANQRIARSPGSRSNRRGGRAERTEGSTRAPAISAGLGEYRITPGPLTRGKAETSVNGAEEAPLVRESQTNAGRSKIRSPLNGPRGRKRRRPLNAPDISATGRIIRRSPAGSNALGQSPLIRPGAASL